jgi:cellulose synthase/poly-beta-1,6-N-acetylglucosamine synthase-like glycosyltransferase
MLSFLVGFDKVPMFQFLNTTPETSFSVIIPFRNESENLPGLLTTIQKLRYSSTHVEFLFVDDASTDNSVSIIKKYQQEYPDTTIHILQNKRTSNSPKKDAIQTAIKEASYEWIITTDADCQLPKSWLDSYNAFIQKNDPVMIAGPVSYLSKYTFLEAIQKAEFHTLQATTIGAFGLGAPMMCNGANLAYKKAIFREVEGFSGNDHITSGDDVFLFEKIYHAYPKKVSFIKSEAALVHTLPEKTWKNFIEQRIRWASKSSNYQSTFTKLVGVIVFLGNLSLVIGCFFTIFQYLSWYFLVSIFVVKVLTDLFLLQKFHSFFEKRDRTRIFLLQGFLYPFISVLIVILMTFSGYTWKGRYFTK